MDLATRFDTTEAHGTILALSRGGRLVRRTIRRGHRRASPLGSASPRAVRDAESAARAARALLRPRVLRPREAVLVAARLADGMPPGRDPEVRRLGGVRDLRPVDRRRPATGRLPEGLLQRVPAPRDAVVQGNRAGAR